MSIDDKNLISLKEAAELTGYSADYIGQLIRNGKIYGKQVYTNIAWMTTEHEVMNYKNKKTDDNKKSASHNSRSAIKNWFKEQRRKVALEISILKVFFQNSRSALPVLIILILSFLLLTTSIFYFYFNQSKFSLNNQSTKTINSELVY